jgi:Flp pilus assembly protein TadB
MAGVGLPHAAIREQVADALDLVVHQARLPDGTGASWRSPRSCGCAGAGDARALRVARRRPEWRAALSDRLAERLGRCAGVSLAVVLAGLAGALAVAGAWDALAAAEQAALARAVGRWTAPLRAARREGRAPTAPERRRLALVGAGALLAGGWLLAGPLAGAACATAGPAGVGRIVRARRERWRADLAQGAPHAARALADALAGGHAVRGAIAVAAGGGVPGAAGGELSAAGRALALGARTEDVLEALRRRAATRVGHDRRRDPAAARAGGDLAGLLRSIAAGLEEARAVEADARSATAQARFTRGSSRCCPWAPRCWPSSRAPATSAPCCGAARAVAARRGGALPARWRAC